VESETRTEPNSVMMLIAAQRDRAGAEIGQHYELFNERVRTRVIAAAGGRGRDASAGRDALRSPCRRRHSARS